MSTPRVLSPRALQEYASSFVTLCHLLILPRLLKGNYNNYISVKVGPEVIVRVHRPVAMRFSMVWKRTLQDKDCRVVTVVFPPDPLATSPAGSSAVNPGNAPATNQGIPPPPQSPSNKDIMKFVIQWMEQGGADPKGNNAVNYPRGYRPGLERLLALTQMLEIDDLTDRINLDLGNMPQPVRFCPICRRIE